MNGAFIITHIAMSSRSECTTFSHMSLPSISGMCAYSKCTSPMATLIFQFGMRFRLHVLHILSGQFEFATVSCGVSASQFATKCMYVCVSLCMHHVNMYMCMSLTLAVYVCRVKPEECTICSVMSFTDGKLDQGKTFLYDMVTVIICCIGVNTRTLRIVLFLIVFFEKSRHLIHHISLNISKV